MKLEAVAFDLDGTLYANSSLYKKAVPLFLKHPRLFSKFYRVRKKLRKIRPIEDFYTLQKKLFAREMGIPVDEAASLIETVIYPAWESVIQGAAIFPGVRLVLEELKRYGLKLAVLSDFPVTEKLKLLHLDGLWDYQYSTEEVGYLKPNPEPFLHLLKALGCKPESVLYVGNNFDLDIVGAANAGMKTAFITNRPPKKGADFADIVFSSYSEMIPKLKSASFL